MQPCELRRAGAELGVPLDEAQADLLIRYVALMERWNARFNLVSRRDIGRVWSRHVLDSLSIAPFLGVPHLAATSSNSVTVAVDVGTGAGFPGIPLAIADAQVRWHLIDRNQRKIRFLEIVVTTLGLENVAAHALDLSAPLPDDLRGVADVVVSRAVDGPAGLLPLAEPLLAGHARIILMTGAAGNRTAVSGLPSGFEVGSVRDLVVPGLDRTHEVTIIERAGDRPGVRIEDRT